MIKCLPKIFKIAKRDENTTFVLVKKDFDSLFFVVVSCIVILFQFRKFQISNFELCKIKELVTSMQKQDYNSKLFIDKVKDKLYTFVSGQMKEI